MNEQAKMQRMLRMLMLLSGSRRYSLTELMERFEISESTVYRSLESFEAAGFVLERKQRSYRLEHNGSLEAIEKLLHFSEEEAYILLQTLEQIAPEYPARKQLLLKLNTLFDLKALARQPDKQKMEIIRVLKDAIEKGRQLLLKSYRSSNSDCITDRLVEPFAFSEDYAAAWCFDTESNSVKQFKISRISGVELMPQGWKHSHLHKMPFTDAFRMSAAAPVAQITGRLSLKAYNLLIEEYPLTQKHISAADGHYCLELPVADFNGIGRFVLGMPGEIWDIQPVDFRNFLRDKIKNWSLSVVDSDEAEVCE